MGPKARTLVQLLTVLLPSQLRRIALVRVLGWRMDEGATLGWSIVSAHSVQLGRGSRIGHFNVIRNLECLEIGEEATIGQWNWITAAQPIIEADPSSTNRGRLVIGDQAAITSRHYVDCTGGVTVGPFTTIAGVRTTVLSHQISTATSMQSALTVEIGSYCFVGSDVRITPGSSIAERCVIAMGAVVSGSLDEPGTLYGGVPARPIKLVGDGAYFHRKKGYVEPS